MRICAIAGVISSLDVLLMPKFAANLSMMFTEHAFLDRFDAAAEAGFRRWSFFSLRPSARGDCRTPGAQSAYAGSVQPAAGRLGSGERGLAAVRDRFAEFKSGVSQALDSLAATGVKRVHMTAGNAARSEPKAEASYRRAIEYAAPVLAGPGLTFFWSRSMSATCRATS